MSNGMKVLLVKTSSLGDLVHALCAVTEAQQHREFQLSWVVEAGLEPIVQLHPAVQEVIPVAIRRWRRSMMQSASEVGAFISQLRSTEYELIIDAQGLLKSAMITRFARGQRHGFDRASARESIASRFYDQCHPVPVNLHAVTRQKLLLAGCLGYEARPGADYGIPVDTRRKHKKIMLLHGTSWASKELPESYWRELAILATAAEYELLLLGGNEQEWQRAQRIGAGLKAEVLRQPPLKEVIKKMQSCAGVLSVDTGLGHLAAALGLPLVALFGATDPRLTGMTGSSTKVITNNHLACIPCKKRGCQWHRDASSIYPPCYQPTSPEDLWQALQAQMRQSEVAG